jgi:hypothetical protein
MRQAYELLALALALEDEGRGDDEVVAAVVNAAEGHVVRLQSAYASTLYLLQDLPFDKGAQRLAAVLLRALEQVAEHETPEHETPPDTRWLDLRDHRDDPGALAEQFARRAGDRESVLRDAQRLQADLRRLRRPT